MVDLALVIVTYNTKEITLNCLRSIFNKNWESKIEVLLLDNGSDGTVDIVKKNFPKVKAYKSDTNLGFSGGNNFLIKKVYKNCRYVLLLNSDTLVQEDSLDSLLQFADSNEVGIATCELENKDRTFQPNAGDLPNFSSTFFWVSGIDDLINKTFSVPSLHHNEKSYFTNGKEVGWISGAVMLVNSNLFDKIGFLDEKIFMYGEDIDFCWRAKKHGFKIMWTNDAKIIHLGGASSADSKFKQWRGEFLGLKYLYKKYYGFLQNFLLNILIYKFLFLRVVGYTLIGKLNYAKTYAKIAVSI